VVCLEPEELTTQPWNLVFLGIAFEIVPGEARENHRHVELMICRGQLYIRRQHIFLPTVYSLEGSIAPHVPWLNNIHGRIHLGPRRIASGIARQRSPARGRTTHVSDMVLCRSSGLEPVD